MGTNLVLQGFQMRNNLLCFQLLCFKRRLTPLMMKKCHLINAGYQKRNKEVLSGMNSVGIYCPFQIRKKPLEEDSKKEISYDKVCRGNKQGEQQTLCCLTNLGIFSPKVIDDRADSLPKDKYKGSNLNHHRKRRNVRTENKR